MSALGHPRCSLGNDAAAHLLVSTPNLIQYTLNGYPHDYERVRQALLPL
jgi:hypothetical protein